MLGCTAVNAGTEDGCLRVLSAERVAAYLDAESAAPGAATAATATPATSAAAPPGGLAAAALLEEAMAVGWAQRPFPGHPLSCVAFSPDGDFCAAVSAAAKQVGGPPLLRGHVC